MPGSRKSSRQCLQEVRTEFCHVWTISNFTSRPGFVHTVGFFIHSPRFYPSDNREEKWFLVCYPSGKNCDSEGNISLYLKAGFNVKAQATLSILTSEKVKTNIRSLEEPCLMRPGQEVGFDKFISRCSLLARRRQLLPNDCLRIVCEVTTIKEIDVSSIHQKRRVSSRGLEKCVLF